MPAADLDVIAKRCKSATPGPWTARHYIGCSVIHCDQYDCAETEIATLRRGVRVIDNTINSQCSFEVPMQTRADAEFIAHAREDMAFLLAEISRLRGEPSSKPINDECLNVCGGLS